MHLHISLRPIAALILVPLLAACTPSTAQTFSRDALIAYAASLKGKKQAELKAAIYAISQPQSTLAYGSGSGKTWWGFYATDRVAETNECVNRYSSARFYFTGERGTAPSGMNIEHSFPKSWWGGGGVANVDLFNLYPSDSQANSSKSNYPMAVVTNVTHSSGDGYDLVGTGEVDGKSGVQCWEPGDQYKGDFARSYMYMATTYQNYTWQSAGTQELTDGSWPTLKPWAYTLYLQWLKADSVSDLEIARNNAVYAIQQNRNLYIDFPYLAEYVWGDSADVAFDPATSITTATDDARYTGHAEDVVDADVAQPIFSPQDGTYTDSVIVSLTCATPLAQIYYTTDGTAPTLSSTPYSAPFLLTASATVNAVAALGASLSAVSQADYIIRAGADNGGGTDLVRGDTVYCLLETFDQCAGTGGGEAAFSTGGSGELVPDVAGWDSAKGFGGDRCARFGTSKVAGSVTTPPFSLPAGVTTVSLVAAPWGSDGNTLNVALSSGEATLSASAFTLTANQWDTVTLTLTAASATTVQLTLSAPKRFWLDSFAAFYLKPSADAISGVASRPASKGQIYSLAGHPAGTDPATLAPGIYVRKGKKFMVR